MKSLIKKTQITNISHTPSKLRKTKRTIKSWYELNLKKSNSQFPSLFPYNIILSLKSMFIVDPTSVSYISIYSICFLIFLATLI